MNLPQIEAGFVSWIQATSQDLGLTRMALRDQMRDLGASVHPKTVESWFRGTAMPSYGHLVVLVTALGQLPPALGELCPERIEPVVVVEDHSPDTADTDPAPGSRPSPGRRRS